MSAYILVHGAWHGGWCWFKVREYLEERGNKVITPDLPGHGDDPGTTADASMDRYVERVLASVEACDEAPVLVGHSMAGAVISQVAEQAPESIAGLVFVAAFVPQDGESILDLSGANLASVLRGNLVFSEDGNTVTLPDDMIVPAFYHDCDESDIEFARERLRPQSAGVFSTPVHLSDGRYGSVAKQFIECIEDQAIHISLQRTMARRARCLVNTLQTGHSPFFSAPAALAAHIARIGIKDAMEP